MSHARPSWFTVDDCNIDDFVSVVDATTSLADYPLARSVEQGVLIYDAADLEAGYSSQDSRIATLSEIARAVDTGPGVVVVKGAFSDLAVVDAATAAFRSIIRQEKDAGTSPGDHFAEVGANDRVWNALEKLAVADPQTFIAYYANHALAIVSEAWLGPRYQVTSQLNQVNPGGKAQTPHRDYHLGFLSQQSAQAYPAHTHRMSPGLTLQGAIAHCDMPLESGPTFLVPHSQKYEPGYIAWHLEDFRDTAQQYAVQIPLQKGDGLFFNPALFHGAGENRSTDISRLGNLLQISSAFGRAMERVDRGRIVDAIYPGLLEVKRAGGSDRSMRNVIAASAEGYAFPLNLDVHPPSGSEPPMAQSDLVLHALAHEWTPAQLAEAWARHQFGSADWSHARAT